MSQQYRAWQAAIAKYEAALDARAAELLRDDIIAAAMGEGEASARNLAYLARHLPNRFTWRDEGEETREASPSGDVAEAPKLQAALFNLGEQRTGRATPLGSVAFRRKKAKLDNGLLDLGE